MPECYEGVKENQAYAARAAEREAKLKADEDEEKRQEEQKEQERADRSKREAQEEESKRIAEQAREQQYLPAYSHPAGDTQPVAGGKASSGSSTAKQDSPRLVDPFGGAVTQRTRTSGAVSDAKLVDPFAPKSDLVDPFGTSSGLEKSSSPSEGQKALTEGSFWVLEHSTDVAVSKLDRDIDLIRSQSGLTINRLTATQMIKEVEGTKSLLNGVSRFVTGGQYGILLKNIATAETPAKREEAEGELGKQVTGGVVQKALSSDLVAQGITTVAPRLFGETVGLVLSGAARAAIGSGAGSILLDSVKTGRDPTEMIRDSSGKVSLSEKQQALVQM